MVVLLVHIIIIVARRIILYCTEMHFDDVSQHFGTKNVKDLYNFNLSLHEDLMLCANLGQKRL